MVTVWSPVPAVLGMLKVAVTEVLLATVTELTMTPPPTVTAVAPVKLVPVRVTETCVPRDPDVGLIAVSAGLPGTLTVNPTVLLAPFAVVTLTALVPAAALGAIVKVADSEAAPAVTPLTVTPVPDMLSVPPARLVPVSVTGTAVPTKPVVGLIAVRLGAVALMTAKFTVPLVPPGVMTATVYAPIGAVAATARLAVAVVALVTLKPLTVTPVPDTARAVAPVRLVPVRVMGTMAPCAPEAGLILDRVGAGGGVATVNVTELLVPFGVTTVTVLSPVAV
jgi:hypothetical protein